MRKSCAFVVAILTLAVSVSACGGGSSSPTAPTTSNIPSSPVPPPVTTSSVAVRAFGSDAPIPGVIVTSTTDPTLTATTDANGVAKFERNISANTRFTFAKDGFLGPREQYFPGDGGTVSLYPVDASHPESVTLGITYGAGGGTTNYVLTQNACVVRGPALQVPNVSLANWQRAAALVNALPLMVSQGVTLRAVDAPDSACAVTFTTTINGSLIGALTSVNPDASGRIVGGGTAYRDVGGANDVRVLAHEFGHLVGLGHNPGSGLMSVTDALNYTDFTSLEKDTSLFKGVRGPGNKIKDVAPR